MTETNEKDAKPADAEGTVQFILFQVGGEAYALPLDQVREIVRVSPMAPVPLAPKPLLGLANLRGQVLPVVSVRRAFGLADGEADDANRVLVFDEAGALTGLLVDRVATIVSVDPAEVESAAPIQHSVDSALLTGVLKASRSRERDHMILDGAAVLEAAVGDARAALARRGAVSAGQGAGAEPADESECAEEELACLVSFEVDGQEYALGLEDVSEIVAMPERISHAPRSHKDLVGVATLRGELLPLVSLRRLFGAGEEAVVEGSKVVVANCGSGEAETRIGLVADHVREVLRAPAGEIDRRPEALSTAGAGAQIRSICHFDGGDRVVTVLDVNALCRLDGEALEDILQTGEAREMDDTTETASQSDSEEAQFVVFRLADELYGAPIDAVQEIVRLPEKMTRVPQTPAFIDGVVNLRGAILPVIDTRDWFGMARIEKAERQRIIVLQIGAARVGFVVDAVAEVKRIPTACIGPAPSNFGDRGGAIERVAQMEHGGDVILLLNVSSLFNEGELGAIAA